MIHFFNPGHETAVLNASPYYMPPANVVAMQQELAYLPAWYANKDDKVFVRNPIDKAFYQSLFDRIGIIPQPISESELTRYENERISFWGISPQAIHYWSELRQNHSLEINIPVWNEKFTDLNSRTTAKDLLQELSIKIPEISKEIVPQFYTSLKDIESVASSSSVRLLSKAPYSSSGRGLLWLPEGGLTRTERQILHGILKKQGCVSIEKVLDKQTDFAMEFISTGSGKVQFAGYSLFETNKKGAYLGNFIGSQQDIEKHLTKNISESLLNDVKVGLEKLLSVQCGSIYNGCIGVDMMIYKDRETYHLHPCLEVNMRYNMGYLALRFSENYVCAGSEGHFYIDFDAKAGEMERRHREMLSTYSLTIEDGRIKQGYMSLCPVTSESHYRAYVLID